jgi:hypothetical protein
MDWPSNSRLAGLVSVRHVNRSSQPGLAAVRCFGFDGRPRPRRRPIQNVAFPVFATVGALIVSRQAGNAVGWLCCAVGLTSSLGLNDLGFGYVHYVLAGPGGSLPGGVGCLAQRVAQRRQLRDRPADLPAIPDRPPPSAAGDRLCGSPPAWRGWRVCWTRPDPDPWSTSRSSRTRSGSRISLCSFCPMPSA